MTRQSRWLRAPRLRSNEPGDHERRATWLELFYDLVYVVAVAALAQVLLQDVSLPGIVAFVGLFLPVWWSWAGVTLYNDRFDTDDLFARGVTLLEMGGAAALALTASTALTGPGFALAYAGIRIVLVAQYVRVASHVPTARPLARRYALGFSIAAALWIASVLVPAPWRFVLWAIAMVVDIGTPLTARKLQAMMPVSVSHLPERIGLFTIIVLGEAVAAVVRGVHSAGVTLASGLAAALALALAFALWWIYFENLSARVVRRTRVAGQVWFYGHFPLVMGITAMAAGAERVILGGPLAPAERWLLGGSVAVSFLALAVIHLATAETQVTAAEHDRATSQSVAIVAALAWTAACAWLPPPALLAGLTAIAVAQVGLDPPVKLARSAS